MTYSYETEKAALMTDEGQRMLLKVRDWVQKSLATSGAFRMDKAMGAAGSGSSWTQMACVERLVELGEIVELPRQSWAQYRVFSTPEVHNR